MSSFPCQSSNIHLSRSSLQVSFVTISCFLLLGCFQEATSPTIERTTSLLTSLLQDEDAEVRRTVAESLGKIGDPTAVDSVLALMNDPVPTVRVAAARALGRMADNSNASVLAALVKALEDTDDRVKQVAAIAIGELEPSDAQLKPIASLVQAKDVKVRRTALHALLDTESGQWTLFILPALNDSDEEVRQGAMAVLANSGNAEVRREIEKRFLKDPSPAVRAEAAYRLGVRNDSGTRSVLQEALKKDPDPAVRRWIEADLNSSRASD